MLNRDPASWPPFPGPDAPEAVRLRWAVERFLPPAARTAPAPPAPAPALAPVAPGRDPAELARVLGLSLDRFAEAGLCLEVRVSWWPEPLWFVPGPEDVAALEAAGVSRGRVWTAGELADLLAVPGLTTAGGRTVALAKLAVAGEVAEVRAAGPLCCDACKGQRWWRSTAGRTVCATCHPPAVPGLVAEWRESER